MKTVYKYPVPMTSQAFELPLPVGFKFLRIGAQNNNMFVWLEVKKDTPQNVYKFCLYGTGQDIPDSAEYLSTFDSGPFVIHLYKL